MRLTDHLAASRCLYLRAAASLPDIMLIDVPACFAGAGLPLGRYYPILLETAAELTEFEAFLDAPREQLVLPDLLDRRPSGSVSECVVITRYPPVLQGWPWVLLCQWPASYIALAPPGSDLFARGSYTIEVLDSRGDLIRTENRLRATLTGHNLRHISDGPPDIGHA